MNGSLAFAAAQVLWLFAPLLVAAAVSGLVLRLDLFPGLRRPIDGGRSVAGRRIFGDSKTWRGVFVAVAACIAAVWLQKGLSAGNEHLWLVNYDAIDPVPFGAAMGGGAMVGELPNSFTKRRLGIAPGGTTSGWKGALFYVWDQVDLLTGAWPVLSPWLRPSALVLATSFLLALVMHPIVALIGYLIGGRKSPR
jgi:hypothetical protein